MKEEQCVWTQKGQIKADEHTNTCVINNAAGSGRISTIGIENVVD